MAEATQIKTAPTADEELDPRVLAKLDGLQVRYLRALDERDMHAWAACFSGDDASYICIPRENDDSGLPLAIMCDDNLNRIFDRIQYVTKIWAGTYEDYT